MRTTAVIVVAGVLVAVNAFAECGRIDYRPGRLWLAAPDHPSYTISIPITDFTPSRLVCLAARLKEDPELRRHKSFEVLIFSSHDAAMCYHGDMDIGDRIPAPGLTPQQGRCAYADWSRRQLHGVYSFHYLEPGEHVVISPMGGHSDQSWRDTRIELPATSIPRCRLQINGRCVQAMGYPEYGGYDTEVLCTGAVTLSASVSRHGIVGDVAVEDVRDMKPGCRWRIIQAATANLKSWRVEPAPYDETIRTTYVQRIDPSLSSMGMQVDLDLPRQIAIRFGPEVTAARSTDETVPPGDEVPSAVRSIAFYGSPVILAWCWTVWLRAGKKLRWRMAAALAGLMCASANAILYYAWMNWAAAHSFSDATWQMGQRLGETYALPLAAAAAVAAAAGLGKARLPLMLSALLGLLLWIPARFL